MEIIELYDVMQLLNLSRKEATRILNMPGCPKLPRTKRQRFRVIKDPFLEWVAGGCKPDFMER